MTRPICSSCRTEMQPQGPTVIIGYQHNHAPVDFSRATTYSCPGCGVEVLFPIGYCYGHAIGEPKDCIPVQPSAPAKPERKLP